MKRILLYSVLAALCACGNKNDQAGKDNKANPQDLIGIDKQFSRMSVEKGIKEAFVFYAADDVIKMQNKQFPVMGKETLKKMLEEEEVGPPPVLSWEPVKADIAASGDLGYTFGNWKMVIKDSASADTFFGNYMTIWKKMADGTWKYVLDGSATTPRPGE